MNMRRIVFTVVLLSFMSVPCLALEQHFGTGLTTTWWQNDNQDTGLQVSVPLRAGITMGAFKAQLLNAFVYTTVDPDEGESASLARFLDTKLDFSYALGARLPFDLLLGCGFNLPTGYTQFKDDEMALLALPPDLLPIATYGEGLNINPYLAASKEWGRIVAGLGLGYLWRGTYDFSEIIEDYDPGEIMTASASVGYAFTENLQGRLFGEYARYGKDTVDDEDYYQDGALQLIGLGLSYARPAWEINGGLHAIFRAKGKYYNVVAAPIENKKNHGNEYAAQASYRYFLNAKTTLSTGLDFLTIEENDYPKGSAAYAGRRQKITLSGGVERAFANHITGALGLEAFTMQDDQNWYHPEDYRYNGFTLSARVNMQF